MKFLKRLFGKGQSIDDLLDPRTRVYVRGIYFTIRKINPVDHLHGAKVLTQAYQVQTVEDRLKNDVPVNIERVKDHYRDVFTSCVIDPVLVRKEKDAGPGEVWVDRLFLDWEIAEELYMEIMTFTYGKKKVQSLLNQSHLSNPMS